MKTINDGGPAVGADAKDQRIAELEAQIQKLIEKSIERENGLAQSRDSNGRFHRRVQLLEGFWFKKLESQKLWSKLWREIAYREAKLPAPEELIATCYQRGLNDALDYLTAVTRNAHIAKNAIDSARAALTKDGAS